MFLYAKWHGMDTHIDNLVLLGRVVQDVSGIQRGLMMKIVCLDI
jgi:hypothetical protein